jgi:hypothetical protein
MVGYEERENLLPKKKKTVGRRRNLVAERESFLSVFLGMTWRNILYSVYFCASVNLIPSSFSFSHYDLLLSILKIQLA